MEPAQRGNSTTSQTLSQGVATTSSLRNIQTRLRAADRRDALHVIQNIGKEVLVGGVQSQAELVRNREVLQYLIQYSRKEDRSVTVKLGSEKYSLWCSLNNHLIEFASQPRQGRVYSIRLNSEYGITSILPSSWYRSSSNLRLVKALISAVDLDNFKERRWLPQGVFAQPEAADLCSLNNILKLIGMPINGAISGGDYDCSYYNISLKAPGNIRIKVFGYNRTLTLLVEMDVYENGDIKKLSIDEREVSDIFFTIPPICVLLTMHESKRKKLGALRDSSIFVPYTWPEWGQDPQKTSPFWRVLEMFQPHEKQSAEGIKSLAQQVLEATTTTDSMKNLVKLRSLCMESSFNYKVFLALMHAWPMQDEMIKVVAGDHTCEIPLIFLYAQFGILVESSPNFTTDEFIIKLQIDGETDQLEEDLLNCIKNMSSAGVLSHENVMGLLIFAIDYKVAWLLNDCAEFLAEYYRSQDNGRELAEFLINLKSGRALDPEVLSKLTLPLIESLKTGKEIAAFVKALSLDKPQKPDHGKLEILKKLDNYLKRHPAEESEFINIMGFSLNHVNV